MLNGCTTVYRVHLKAIPAAEYAISIDDSLMGKTPPSGETTISTGTVSMYHSPILEIRKDNLYGMVKLGTNYSSKREGTNVKSFKLRDSTAVHPEYDVVFLTDTSEQWKIKDEGAEHMPAKAPDSFKQAQTASSALKAPQNPIALSLNTISDSTQQKKTEDSVKTIAPSKSDRQSSEIIIGQDLSSQGRKRPHHGLDDARKQAVKGATFFFVGVGLNYGVVLPLSLSIKPTTESTLLLLIPSLIASAFEIAGPIVSGVGASKANEIGINEYNVSYTPSSHWGFYKAGWACYAGSSVLSMVNTISSLSTASSSSSSSGDTVKSTSNPGLVLASLALGVAADVMWSITCIKSIGAAKDVIEKVNRDRISIEPLYDSDGRAGLRVSYKF